MLDLLSTSVQGFQEKAAQLCSKEMQSKAMQILEIIAETAEYMT